MLESLWPVILAGVFVIAVVVSFVLGRRTGSTASQVRELTDALATACADRDRNREELEGYRKRVSDHFAETSEKLRDLTLQYRDVYDHLARGAGELCPEGFAQLEGGLGLDALPVAEAAGAPAAPGAEPVAAQPPESAEPPQPGAGEAPETPQREEAAAPRGGGL